MADLLTFLGIIVAVAVVRWTDNAYARYWCGVLSITLAFVLLGDLAWAYVPWPKSVTTPQRGAILAAFLLIIFLCAWQFIRIAIGSYPDSIDFYAKGDSGHSKYAKQLTDFYTEGSRLKDALAAKNDATDSEMEQLDAEMRAFCNNVSGFMESKMGANAITRFLDQADGPMRYVAFNWTKSQRWQSDRVYVLSLYLRNLEMIARSKMYDQK